MSSTPPLWLKRTLLIILFTTNVLSLNHPTWWLVYDSCAQTSLDAAVPNECDSKVFPDATRCLCESAAFLRTAAEGIESECGCSVLEASANTANTICASYGGIALSVSQIIAAGGSCSDGSSSTSSFSRPTSSTSAGTQSTGSTDVTGGSNDANGGDKSGGLSAGLTAAVAVISLLVAIFSAWVGWRTYRYQRAKDKKNKLSSPEVATQDRVRWLTA